MIDLISDTATRPTSAMRAAMAEAEVGQNRLGAAMRQSGVICAAGLYALDHHVERLAIDHDHDHDHDRAPALAAGIASRGRASIVGSGVETNVVFIDVTASGLSAEGVAGLLNSRGVRMGVSGTHRLRAVAHLEVSANDIASAVAAFSAVIGHS